MRRVALLFALAAVLTGCSETTTGSPSGNGDSPPASSTKSPSSSSKSPANRPKKIDLKTISDPCAFFFPQALQAQFKLRNINPTDQTGLWPGSKGCGAGTEDRSVQYTNTAIVSEGVEPNYNSGAGVTKDQVGGFTAYQKTDDGTMKACTLAVDVADGQMLMMMAFELGGKQPGDAYCPKAKALTEAVLAGS